MSGSIPLHPKRGIDPHLTFCRRCGGDGPELVVGHMKKCEIDGKTFYSYPGYQARQLLKEQGYSEYAGTWVDLEDNEKMPSRTPCDACLKEIKLHKEVVAGGGVYWKCNQCHQRGVIKKSPFSDNVRAVGKIEAPAPMGVEFDHCNEHGVRPDEGNTKKVLQKGA